MKHKASWPQELKPSRKGQVARKNKYLNNPCKRMATFHSCETARDFLKTPSLLSPGPKQLKLVALSSRASIFQLHIGAHPHVFVCSLCYPQVE